MEEEVAKDAEGPLHTHDMSIHVSSPELQSHLSTCLLDTFICMSQESQIQYPSN